MLHQGQPNQCGQSENTLPYIQLQPRPYKCSYELFRTMKKWRSVTIRPFRIFHSHQSWIIVCIGHLVIKFIYYSHFNLVCDVIPGRILHMERYLFHKNKKEEITEQKLNKRHKKIFITHNYTNFNKFLTKCIDKRVLLTLLQSQSTPYNGKMSSSISAPNASRFSSLMVEPCHSLFTSSCIPQIRLNS